MLTETVFGLALIKSNVVQSIVRLMEDAWKHSLHWQLSRSHINGNFNWFDVDALLFDKVSTMTNLFWTSARTFVNCSVDLMPANERNGAQFIRWKFNFMMIFDANITMNLILTVSSDNTHENFSKRLTDWRSMLSNYKKFIPLSETRSMKKKKSKLVCAVLISW